MFDDKSFSTQAFDTKTWYFEIVEVIWKQVIKFTLQVRTKWTF